MERNHPLIKSPGAGQIASATALILLGWSSACYAATINRADCDDGRRLAAESLTNHQHFATPKLHPVDHVPMQNNAADVSSLNAATGSISIDNDTASDSSTPFLYLTPRVASALREIFDSAENDAKESLEATQDSAISSPVATTDELSETAQYLEDSSNAESMLDEIERLTLQRQMFRTDI